MYRRWSVVFHNKARPWKSESFKLARSNGVKWRFLAVSYACVQIESEISLGRAADLLQRGYLCGALVLYNTECRAPAQQQPARRKALVF